MSDYFKDKNLQRVRFDTLRNQIDLEQGTVIIPNMNINTSLGYFEVSGKQDTEPFHGVSSSYSMESGHQGSITKAFWKKTGRDLRQCR